MSRKALLIRVLIFGPLFLYFGWGAIKKCNAEQEAEQAAAADKARAEAEIKAATTTRPLPGGGSINVVELTPEQAERLYGIKQAPEGEAKAPPASDVKAPVAAPPAAPAGEAVAPEARAD